MLQPRKEMKRIAAFLITFFMCSGSFIIAQEVQVKSPDGRIEINVSNGEMLTYSITYNGKAIVNHI